MNDAGIDAKVLAEGTSLQLGLSPKSAFAYLTSLRTGRVFGPGTSSETANQKNLARTAILLYAMDVDEKSHIITRINCIVEKLNSEMPEKPLNFDYPPNNPEVRKTPYSQLPDAKYQCLMTEIRELPEDDFKLVRNLVERLRDGLS